MNTSHVLAVVAALSFGPPLLAQGPIVDRKTGEATSSWTVVRVAKWALLGGAVGLGVYALRNSREAEHAYADLRDRCVQASVQCAVENGRYRDPVTEILYARSVNADRRAQFGIYGGQVAALGSVGLFIYDLRNGRGPSDIPYPAKRVVSIGARLNF